MLQIWKGYTQSLRLGQMGLAINVDMAVTAFITPGPVIDFLQNALGLHDPNYIVKSAREAGKAILGIRVNSYPLLYLTSCMHAAIGYLYCCVIVPSIKRLLAALPCPSGILHRMS